MIYTHDERRGMRRVVKIGIGIILVVGNSVMRSPSKQFSPELSSCFISAPASF